MKAAPKVGQSASLNDNLASLKVSMRDLRRAAERDHCSVSLSLQLREMGIQSDDWLGSGSVLSKHLELRLHSQMALYYTL